MGITVEQMDTALKWANKHGQNTRAQQEFLQRVKILLSEIKPVRIKSVTDTARALETEFNEKFKEKFSKWRRAASGRHSEHLAPVTTPQEDRKKSRKSTHKAHSITSKIKPKKMPKTLRILGEELGLYQKRLWIARTKKPSTPARAQQVRVLEERLRMAQADLDAALTKVSGWDRPGFKRNVLETSDGAHRFYFKSVLHNGDCGFFAMESSRSYAVQRFLENREDPELFLLLLGGGIVGAEDDICVKSVPGYSEMVKDVWAIYSAQRGGNVRGLPEVIKRQPKERRKRIVQEYINRCIDVPDGKPLGVEDWADISILRSLAHVEKVNLSIWTIDAYGYLRHSPDNSYTDAPTGRKTYYLLNDHHTYWDQLLPVP